MNEDFQASQSEGFINNSPDSADSWGWWTYDEDAIYHLTFFAQAFKSMDLAIIVCSFQNWMAANKSRNSKHHFHNGHWWIYTSPTHLSVDHFTWISPGKIGDLLAQLSASGILLCRRFWISNRESGYWYSIDQNALANYIADNFKRTDPSRRIFNGDALPLGIEELKEGAPGLVPIDEKLTLDSIPKPLPQPKPGYVYLLRAETGLHKIGLSKDANRRLKDFGRLPFDVSYVCVIKTEDMRELEVALHKRFAEKRVKGEWFNLDVDDVKYIMALSTEEL